MKVSKPRVSLVALQVLCGRRDFAWKPACGSDVPPEAVSVGRAEDGEPLYVGRTMIDGTMTPGKVETEFDFIQHPIKSYINT